MKGFQGRGEGRRGRKSETSRDDNLDILQFMKRVKVMKRDNVNYKVERNARCSACHCTVSVLLPLYRLVLLRCFSKGQSTRTSFVP